MYQLRRFQRYLPLLIIIPLGIWGAAYIFRMPPPSAQSEGEHGTGSHEEPIVKGPHKGRLLSEGDFSIEITIFERGVPPQFRVFAYQSEKPIPPEQFSLSIKLHRLGGCVDEFVFATEADYLRGDKTVEEPHSFDVEVTATHGGRKYDWKYSSYEGRVSLTPQQVKEAEVEIATAGPATLKTTLELPGQIAVNSNRLAHVVPRLSGVVSNVLCNLGDSVKLGQTLASIESREFAESTSDYIEAVHKHEFAQLTFVRTEDLWKQKITPDLDYYKARHTLEESEINKQVTAQKLLSLGLSSVDLDVLAKEPEGEIVPYKVRSPLPNEAITRYHIKAPLDGQIIGKHVTLGEAVKADADAYLIADLSSVWVEIMVYANDVPSVKVGQTVKVRSKSLTAEADGRIAYVSPIIDQATRSAKAIVDLSNPEGLWRPGFFVSVTITLNEQTVPLAVAAEAIQSLRDWSVVFTNAGDVFEAQPLELGKRDDHWVEVLGGIEPGTRYARTNSFLLKADVGKSGATHDH